MEAHLINEKAQRKVAEALVHSGQCSKVPTYLKAGYRAKSKAALVSSDTQALSHKWNAQTAKSVAEAVPLDSKNRGQIFKDAVDAKKGYQQYGQMYDRTYKQYRTVREEFSGASSSSESEKSDFGDALPKKGG